MPFFPGVVGLVTRISIGRTRLRRFQETAHGLGIGNVAGSSNCATALALHRVHDFQCDALNQVVAHDRRAFGGQRRAIACPMFVPRR